jgi:hypothetical protein
MKRWLTVHGFAAQLHAENPKIDKSSFAEAIASRYRLTKARSVYFADDFAIRFCYSNDAGFSNCVVSLATLQKFDDRPFLVTLLQPSGVHTFLANSTLIRKVSHSSQKLTLDNVRGTILGHDIIRDLDGVKNDPSHFPELFETHQEFGWPDNLARIVKVTTSISPTGLRFDPTSDQLVQIRNSAAVSLAAEKDGKIAAAERQLRGELKKHKQKILKLAEIDNVNLRGNKIEQLLTGVGNFHLLGDQIIEKIGDARIVIDLKTKLLGLSSNPKLYNVDKTLKALAAEPTIFCLFFIGVDSQSGTVVGRLVDILDARLIDGTRLQFHWAGRNSRGVTQLSMDAGTLFDEKFRRTIDLNKGKRFINRLLSSGDSK